MTDTRFDGRCTAVYLPAARPLLAAVASRRLAGQPEPSTDWRCTRPPHVGTELPLDEQHLAYPLGPAGPSLRFGPELVEQPPAPDCSNLACQHPQTEHDDDGGCRLCPCPPYDVPYTPPVDDPADDPATAAAPVVAATDLAELVERLARAGAGVVRAEPGDTLLLIIPESNDGSPAVEQVANTVSEFLPGVAVLALYGVAGAVVVPAPAGD
jgi:hypothetical protein